MLVYDALFYNSHEGRTSRTVAEIFKYKIMGRRSWTTFSMSDSRLTLNPSKYGGGQKSPTVTFNINNFLTNGPMDL